MPELQQQTEDWVLLLHSSLALHTHTTDHTHDKATHRQREGDRSGERKQG